MSWNPFLKKRARIAIATAVLLVTPIVYLASYPLLCRMLVGSDAEYWLQHKFDENDVARYRLWNKLEQYYFPPAEWLLDHTPCRHPMLLVARFTRTIEQIENDSNQRRGLGSPVIH